jgi:hypothetical protein
VFEGSFEYKDTSALFHKHEINSATHGNGREEFTVWAMDECEENWNMLYSLLLNVYNIWVRTHEQILHEFTMWPTN